MRPNIYDSLNYAGKINPKRLENMSSIVWSYLRSKYSKNPNPKGMPISISLEPTTSCNLRCPECPSGLRSFTRPTGMLDPILFRNTIDQLYKTLTYLIFYFQGEPYLHKEFIDLVRYASEKKIYTATSTNGHYLNDENARKTVESGLDRLIISLDGTTQDVYQQYRVGGNIEKVLEGARNIVKWKKKLGSKKPYTVFQFLVVQPNEHQIESVKKLAKEIGVDNVGLKTAQIYDYKNGSPLIPTIDYYSRYNNNGNGTYSIKNKLLDHCWKMWHSCVITWDGLVVPCCFDKDAEYVMGDLKKHSFHQIWNGEKYMNFRKALLKGRSEIDMCKNCSEGGMVWG